MSGLSILGWASPSCVGPHHPVVGLIILGWAWPHWVGPHHAALGLSILGLASPFSVGSHHSSLGLTILGWASPSLWKFEEDANLPLILQEIEISFRHVHKELSVTGVRDLQGVAGYTCVHEEVSGWGNHFKHGISTGQLKCDGTRAETRFCLSAKRRSPFNLFLNINQLDALNFIISLFQTSTCFERTCSSSGGQNCIIPSLVSSHWNKWMV